VTWFLGFPTSFNDIETEILITESDNSDALIINRTSEHDPNISTQVEIIFTFQE